TISAMGLKAEAKQRMLQAGVPVVPGYHGKSQDLDVLKKEAQAIGFPLLIKASAGGGGRGMRIVRAPGEFDEALSSARREAMQSFNNDDVLIERFIPHARHIEVQVFGDQQGNIVHLFERECSIQRRYQKIIEESPAVHLPASIRDRILQAAVTAAKAVDYVNAGTVEFVVGDQNDFYFMEMNTRLQVEHPVTEMTTGLDLVEWQLCIAAGEPMPLNQSDIQQHGHAIELRLYAEDTLNDFLPQSGVLEPIHWPQNDAGVRIDTGYDSGDVMTSHYDCMIGKLIVHDIDRPTALRQLQKTLGDTAVLGVATNLSLLRTMIGDEHFYQGEWDDHY
ncbi:MAG: ATP-grasp domain-containing protein, partial [Gammaproteobacteria bacterium]|nr:ATP-grasp domain-containing protein [Gammaproteobacteria bacterium]